MSFKSSQHKSRILIFGQQRDLFCIPWQTLMKTATESLEFHWQSAGECTLDFFMQNHFDLYILEQELENQSGMDWFRLATRNGFSRPSILLADFKNQNLQSYALSIGFEDCLQKKHLQLWDLKKSIDFTLERVFLRAQAQRPTNTQKDGNTIPSKTLEEFFRNLQQDIGVVSAHISKLVNSRHRELDPWVTKSFEVIGRKCKNIVKNAEKISHCSPPPSIKKTPKNILIVEDEIELRTMMIDLLATTGANIFAARDGYEALKIFDQQDIDIILSDVMMPNMDGVTFSHKVYELTKFAEHRPKMFFLTGKTGPELPASVREALDVEILLKPFRIDDLISQVMG